MSQLSRMAAPLARHHVARLAATLLTHGQGIRPPAPKTLPGTVRHQARTAVPTGPTGIGTSAARITARRATGAAPDTTGGQGTGVPELYCPPAIRDDQALGREVNDRLVDWAEEVGLYAGRLARVRAADFGRLMMLAHPDSDDPDRLLAAAKCALAEWATDDYYCDDETMGSRTELLGSHLGPAYAALDPAHLPAGYAPAWERDMADDPVRVALRSGLRDLARYADPSQVARLRHEVAVLFVGYGQEGSWRSRDHMPTVHEYLAHRQINSFLPCIALVDVVGGYSVAAAEYADPRVRRAVTMAATASTLVNDLYSMAKEDHSSGVEFNLPSVIAAEERCSPREAVERSVEIHDELVRTFEAEAAALVLTGSPQLRHFLAGVWAWLGGNREWHSGSLRYHDA
ncbi:family 2 encapsulin nanocompartment cargo protein terpene cyclase [Streptomyces noursei]|uniref:family 2 encapsulin nanocompartment cargo protein terpene cyclase n=1 Tax=Streptomyces noursei TaxID=1971 RepID=UPI0019C2D2DF|nr:family 2 encapsulin nanocompartment cargo protein terpene cyclase [Streptomyces noursei]MCZ1020978.1 family 2 encapsulin nanocompartment cargo protein terpene cyclase [Streptomyces noursei]GGX48406.1 2-methylisoborneol synthase [Streptomyces noursei]